MKYTKSEKIFNFTNVLIMLFANFIFFYPIWYILCYSLSDNSIVSGWDISFLPKNFTFINFQAIFQDNTVIINSLWISVMRTLIGSFLHVFLCGLMAYSLSKKDLFGRKFLAGMLLVTMYFNGGLIPNYLLYLNLGLTNNFWGLVLPSVYAAWTIFIMKSFYQGIPSSLEESAKLDGANDIIIYFKIIIPLAIPVMATMGLFSAVGLWNDWFMGDMLMTKKTKLYPLQTVIMKILFQADAAKINSESQAAMSSMHQETATPEGIKMAAIIVSIIPIMSIYPFLQKYFVKGIMVGSVKG